MRDRRDRAALDARLGGWSKRSYDMAVALCAVAAIAFAAPAAAQANHWASPTIAVPRTELPHEPAVFGTVPVPVGVKPTSTRWSRVMRASLDQPALLHLVRDAAGLSPPAQAAFVQAAVNRAVRNRSPSYNCSDDGYWAAAGETLGRGVGDCIDIAIAKMEALRLLGVPARDLYLTTGYAGAGGTHGRGRESAALLVRTGEGFWLLGEGVDHVVAAGAGDSHPDFAPIITYGVGKTWIHGKLVRTASRVAAEPEVASASGVVSATPSK